MHFTAFATVCVAAGAWGGVLQVVFNPWYRKQQPAFLDSFGMMILYQTLTFLIVYSLILTVTFVLDARALSQAAPGSVGRDIRTRRRRPGRHLTVMPVTLP